jgi:hypothetical protein
MQSLRDARARLIHVQRALVKVRARACRSGDGHRHRQWAGGQVLVAFVKDNELNQRLVFCEHLPHLRKHLGGLVVPEQSSGQLAETDRSEEISSIGTEEVIIECLKNNSHLVDEEVSDS